MRQKEEQADEEKEVKAVEPRSKKEAAKETQVALKNERAAGNRGVSVSAYPEPQGILANEGYSSIARAGGCEQQAAESLMSELRRFRMESSTPLECMMFLAHLIKRSLEIENN